MLSKKPKYLRISHHDKSNTVAIWDLSGEIFLLQVKDLKYTIEELLFIYLRGCSKETRKELAQSVQEIFDTHKELGIK